MKIESPCLINFSNTICERTLNFGGIKNKSLDQGSVNMQNDRRKIKQLGFGIDLSRCDDPHMNAMM